LRWTANVGVEGGGRAQEICKSGRESEGDVVEMVEGKKENEYE